MRTSLAIAVSTLILASCGDGDGLSTAELEAAAKERVRETLNLAPNAVLFSKVFVGEPVNGDLVVCGTVSGETATGESVTPRRFIAAVDPARWVKFEPARGIDAPSRPDMFLEWHTACAGEEEVV